jgi:hypothetical protein
MAYQTHTNGCNTDKRHDESKLQAKDEQYDQFVALTEN